MVIIQNRTDYNVVSKYEIRIIEAAFTPEKGEIEESELGYVIGL